MSRPPLAVARGAILAPLRRASLAAATIAVAAVLLSSAPLARGRPAVAPADVPKPSGLRWASGITNAPVAAFGRWRGRPVDVYATFHRKDSWDGIIANSKVFISRRGPLRVVGFPMLPQTHRGQLPQCAAGAFDAEITRIRNTLLRHDWGGSWLRLGWEMNRVEGGNTGGAFPWAALVSDKGSSYIRCFRRWAAILNPRPGAKNFTLVWHPGTGGSFPYSIERLWPGGDVVDVVATNAYDRCPPSRTAAAWDARQLARDRWGNPAGLVSWQAFARGKNKPLAIPEWGVGGELTRCPEGGGFDNPLHIRKMWAWLSANAGRGPGKVVLESYFDHVDATGSFVVFDPAERVLPRSSAAYRALWGR